MPDKLNTVERIACAQVWGMPETEALKSINSVRSEGCKSEDDDTDDYPALLKAAAIKFPVTLTGEKNPPKSDTDTAS